MQVSGCSYVNFEELCTILADIEAVINSRPLTAIPSEVQESELLTLAHFLVGKHMTSLPTFSGRHPTAANSIELTRRWRRR